MPDDKTKNIDVVGKVGDFIKTWLPIVITIGGLITGYFVFKAEVRHQFEMQQVETQALRNEITALREQIETNRREWQRGVESELRTLREDAMRRDFRIQNLERGGRNGSGSSSPSGFTSSP